MLNLYENAPGASRASLLPPDSYCQGLTLAGFDGTTQSCVASFLASPTALATEWILAARVDQRLGVNDNVFGRFKLDHGLQPTLVDPINSNFSALSNQPSWDVQVNEAHTFSPNMTNVLTAAGSHYVALFAQNHQLAASTFPYDVISQGYGHSVPFTELNQLRRYPQGRNITQYQFIDDFSWSKGKNTYKFGGNFRRYDVSDHNFFYNSPTVYFGYGNSGLQQFADGLAYQYRMADNFANNVPIASWGLGLYAEDQIKVTSNFTLMLALRQRETRTRSANITALRTSRAISLNWRATQRRIRWTCRIAKTSSMASTKHFKVLTRWTGRPACPSAGLPTRASISRGFRVEERP